MRRRRRLVGASVCTTTPLPRTGPGRHRCRLEMLIERIGIVRRGQSDARSIDSKRTPTPWASTLKITRAEFRRSSARDRDSVELEEPVETREDTTGAPAPTENSPFGCKVTLLIITLSAAAESLAR